MEENPHDTFRAMEELLKRWLDGARDREIRRVLELVQAEFHRRGYTLSYEVTRRRPEGRQEA